MKIIALRFWFRIINKSNKYEWNLRDYRPSKNRKWSSNVSACLILVIEPSSSTCKNKTNETQIRSLNKFIFTGIHDNFSHASSQQNMNKKILVPSIPEDASWDCRWKPCSYSMHQRHEPPDRLPVMNTIKLIRFHITRAAKQNQNCVSPLEEWEALCLCPRNQQIHKQDPLRRIWKPLLQAV